MNKKTKKTKSKRKLQMLTRVIYNKKTGGGTISQKTRKKPFSVGL